MPTETLDRVTEGPGTVFNDTNDGQALLTRGPRSGLGNRFNVQPSLKIEVLVGLPNSYSDLWVNIPVLYLQALRTLSVNSAATLKRLD